MEEINLIDQIYSKIRQYYYRVERVNFILTYNYYRITLLQF
jgi:hypothetical protein